MRSKGVIAFGFLVVLTLTLATGCTTELRSLQGANQQLVAQREVLNQQIADLDAKLAEEKQGKAELEAQIRKLEADVDYWTGQAQAYQDAIDKFRAIGVPGGGEQRMQGLAAEMGGVYLEGGGIRHAYVTQLQIDIDFITHSRVGRHAEPTEGQVRFADSLTGDLDSGGIFVIEEVFLEISFSHRCSYRPNRGPNEHLASIAKRGKFRQGKSYLLIDTVAAACAANVMSVAFWHLNNQSNPYPPPPLI